jgi:hypothetical protein
MWKGLEMARYFTSETGELHADFPVQIGEFAINENPPYNGNNTKTKIENRYGRYIGVALSLGIPNFYLWNLYCSGQQGAPEGFTWQKGVQYEDEFLYEWMDGKWLIEPDGSWGHAANFLNAQWQDTLSTESSTFESEVAVFPNPASDYLILEGVPNHTWISIFDINGRRIKKIEYVKDKKIMLLGLQKGVFILKIQTPQTIKKLIIN